jgi:hypothetical protein
LTLAFIIILLAASAPKTMLAGLLATLITLNWTRQ